MAKEKLTRIDIMMKRIFAHFASIPLVLPVLLSHATRPKLSDDVRFNLCEYYTEQGVGQGGPRGSHSTFEYKFVFNQRAARVPSVNSVLVCNAQGENEGP